MHTLNPVRKSGRTMLLIVVIAAGPGWIVSRESGHIQARALADLVVDIVHCSSVPCLGTDVRGLRDLIGDRIVSDGVETHTDLAVAYPEAGRALRGIVRWDLGLTVDAIAMTVVEFGDPPSSVLAAMEEAFPGCEMESDSGEADPDTIPSGAADEIEEDAWSCTIEDEGGDRDIYLYFGRDILVLEIDA